MNFSIFKRKNKQNNINNNKLEKDEVFNVKDLYVTYMAKVVRNSETDGWTWLGESDSERIIVKKINDRSVENILNNAWYFIFHSMSTNMFDEYFIDKYIGYYMINELKPLSMILMDKSKTTIRKGEILSLLYLKQEITTANSFKDVVLKQIYETLSRVNKSSLENERKNYFRNQLVEIARNYVDILKNMSNSNSKAISLNVNHESIINLRKEVMRKLVEIEMQLPPENIDTLSQELMLLEQEFVKSK